jgi:Ala-tRNA(Pro) deacylase
VLPANRRIELSRLNHFLWGYQLELATEGEIARNCTDCEVGVLPPFGSQYGLTTIMDRSLLQADEIVFEGNNHREAIRMKLEDFQIIEQPLICSFSE